MDNKSIATRFSAAAKTYHSTADIQKRIAKELFDLMDTLPTDQHYRILEIGCGTGFVTELLAQTFTKSSITALDISEDMVSLTKNRLKKFSNVTIHCVDFLSYHEKVPFDIIISSSSLHWIHPIEDALTKASSLLKPSGHLLLSLMLHNTFRELHEARKAVTPHKPVVKRLPSYISVVTFFNEQKGYTLPYCEKKEIFSYFENSSSFLKTVHNQGVTGGFVSHNKTLLNRKELASLKEYYDKNYNTLDGRVKVTYSILKLHVQKENI